VLIKGGHGQGAESIDYLIDGNGTIALAAPRIATKNTHGTGCSLSSAIAAGLAKGEDMESAVRNAKAWVSAASWRPIVSASATAMDRSIISMDFIIVKTLPNVDAAKDVVPAKAGTHMWTAPVAQELFDV
jgi:hydroxymethylpyrimidine/phosphomethylpyrimidine kinase